MPPPNLGNLSYQWITERVDGEPRVRDVVLGEALGYDRPRDIRKLIERLGDKLAAVGTARHRVALFQKGNGSTGQTTEHLLNLSQINYLITRCSLPNADEWCKQIALHPETKAHVAGAHAANAAVGNNVAAKSAATFTADASQKTGQSERTVRLDAERGESIPEPILPPELIGLLRSCSCGGEAPSIPTVTAR